MEFPSSSFNKIGEEAVMIQEGTTKSKTNFSVIVALIFKVAGECGLGTDVGMFGPGERNKTKKYIFCPQKEPSEKKWQTFQSEILRQVKPEMLEFWKEYWKETFPSEQIEVIIEFSDELVTSEDFEAMKHSNDPMKTLGIRQLMRRQNSLKT